MVNRLTILLTNLCRGVLALTFVFSGYVKAIDPLGSQYKFQDYLDALSLGDSVPSWLLLVAAVLLAAFEFSLGICMLLAIRRKLSAFLSLLFMSVMTPLTVWVFLADPVQDCGCFGDAVVLTNGQTLAKNIVLLACAIVVCRWPYKMVRFISSDNQWIAINYTLLFILVSSFWSLYTLPPFDFRPYHPGADIRAGMLVPEGAKAPRYETTFILRKQGVEKEFTLENYPDSTWEFVDSKTRLLEKGYEPPIHDFSLQRVDTEEDITDSVLARKGYTFLLVSPHLENADDSNFGDIDFLYEYCQSQQIPFYGLTASGTKAIRHWQDITGAEYPFCNVDATTLKTMIRSNPGVLLLKDGKVIRKWSHNRLPQAAELTMPLSQSVLGRPAERSVAGRIATILSWFVLPLLLLILADRTWAWSKWLRSKKKSKKDNQHTSTFNHQVINMRKKIVAGNWKMNMNLQEGVALAKEINEALVQDKPNCDVVICTPFIHLASVAQVLDATVVGLGAENCADKEKGAYTGEVSAAMVKSTGAQYVILGHSERREYYGETAEVLKEKVKLALANGLKVIFCCGETLAEREANRQNEVVKAELEGSVFNLTAEEWKSIILAYEPIWAIGTGKTATSDQAEEMLAYIRGIVAEQYGQEVADETSILYGGSCKASNAPELFSKPNIDGGLIGGASLKTADFKGIIDAWK